MPVNEPGPLYDQASLIVGHYSLFFTCPAMGKSGMSSQLRTGRPGFEARLAKTAMHANGS